MSKKSLPSFLKTEVVRGGKKSGKHCVKVVDILKWIGRRLDICCALSND